jgi:membrane-associated phospholipid phosphatase
MRDGLFADLATAAARRFKAHWRLKLALVVIMNAVFWTAYLFLSRHALFPTHELPMTWLDQGAGFHPRGWTWVYESAFLLGAIVPWLISTRQELRRYVVGFAILAGTSFVIFAVFPVASPRPVELQEYPASLFIARLDGPLNAFPSLHAGFLVYNLSLTWRLFARGCPRIVMAGLFVWAALILFATLATKQHYAVDLLAGGALGWLADRLAWGNSAAVAMANASTRRKRDVASHAG